ncbi:MAG TPA: TetR/AcrR family transcriptional regulator C-terminal domain-containing protein [Thermomicrobiales bacterium]|nr:TetR/AcrR family transcriptional regulator C-terminal domain-containing protein [Thermomicrobiales bacterium]
MIRAIPQRRARAGDAAPRPERRVLDRARIVRAALDLLDEVGLDGLTMRRLAARLGVQAGALYRHIRDKGELLDLLVEAICAEQREPDPALPWREQVRALARDELRILRSRRDAARLAASTVPNGPERLRLIEASLRALRAAGFDAADAVQISLLLNTYVTGLVLEEETSPAAAAEAAALRDPAVFDVEARFTFGLEVLLAGLEARLRATAAGRAGS